MDRSQSNTNISGATSEHLAIAWLLSQGYYVFRNVAFKGPIDLIAMKPNGKNIIRIDVKTAATTYIKKDGTRSVSIPEVDPDDQIKLHVRRLIVHIESGFVTFSRDEMIAHINRVYPARIVRSSVVRTFPTTSDELLP